MIASSSSKFEKLALTKPTPSPSFAMRVQLASVYDVNGTVGVFMRRFYR